MSITQVAFILISVVTLGSALAMVTSRTVFVAALWMVSAFVGVAALYVLLEAGFLAAIQLLVYAGGIAVLILFAIMLTPRVMQPMEEASRFNDQWIYVAAVSAFLFAGFWVLAIRTAWPVNLQQVTGNNVFLLGRGFMTQYLLPFEVTSALLLVALVGAIVIARD